MRVYLVQHGMAKQKSVDPARPLTERGHLDTRQVAAFATRLGLEVHQIRHSGKTRAAQTAMILGEALSPPGGVVIAPPFQPGNGVVPTVCLFQPVPPSGFNFVHPGGGNVGSSKDSVISRIKSTVPLDTT